MASDLFLKNIFLWVGLSYISGSLLLLCYFEYLRPFRYAAMHFEVLLLARTVLLILTCCLFVFYIFLFSFLGWSGLNAEGCSSSIQSPFVNYFFFLHKFQVWINSLLFDMFLILDSFYSNQQYFLFCIVRHVYHIGFNCRLESGCD